MNTTIQKDEPMTAQQRARLDAFHAAVISCPLCNLSPPPANHDPDEHLPPLSPEEIAKRKKLLRQEHREASRVKLNLTLAGQQTHQPNTKIK